jgi:hypothetical protein
MAEGSGKAADDAAQGFLAGIGSSIRAHVDERLKSPFGGAFIVAWLVLHWKGILVLALSDNSIEERILTVADQFDSFNSVFLSICLVFAIAVLYYILSSAFLTLAEGYEWLRRRIERKFDSVRWVSPADYMASKSRNMKKVADLSELAADNLTAIDRERSLTLEAVEKQHELQKHIASMQVEASDVATKLRRQTDYSNALEATMSQALRSLKSQADYFDANLIDLNRTNERVRTLLKMPASPNAKMPPAWRVNANSIKEEFVGLVASHHESSSRQREVIQMLSEVLPD